MKLLQGDDGRFKRGEHRSPSTEFKKGEHWRPAQLFRESSYLMAEYLVKKRSCSEIAHDFGVTEAAILFWLRKHGIHRRTVSEARAHKHWGLTGEMNGMYGRRGEGTPGWKGGVTPERQSHYNTISWRKVARAVRSRDLVCQRCGSGRELHIHHIVPFEVEELRSEADNLILLCVSCHRWVHSRENVSGEFLAEGGIQYGDR